MNAETVYGDGAEPVLAEAPPPFTSVEEQWDFILGLAGSAKGLYDEFGGSVEYVRTMRDEAPLPL